MNAQLRAASASFTSEEAQRQQELAEGREDEARRADSERRERLIRYQLQLDDAREAADLQLREAAGAERTALTNKRNARTQQLQDLQASLSAETALRRSAAVEQIRLAQQTEAERLAVQQRYASAAQTLLNSVPASVTNNRSGIFNLYQNIVGGNEKQIAAIAVRAVQPLLANLFGVRR